MLTIHKYHQFIFGHKVSVLESEWIFKHETFDEIEEQENLLFKWFELNELETEMIKLGFLKE